MFKSIIISQQRFSDRLIHYSLLCKMKKTGEEFLTLDVYLDGISFLLNYTYENNLEGIRQLLKQAEKLNTNEKVEKAIGPAMELK